jgi:hypothetical protein
LGTFGNKWARSGMFCQISSLNPLILNHFLFPEH